MLNRIRRWFCPDLGIDLGTTQTRIVTAGEGVVLDEPSVVALQKGTRKILGRGTAVGKMARQMLGRTPDSIIAMRPLRQGVITDYRLCEGMLRYFLQKSVGQSIPLKPRTLIAVPGGITPVEMRAVFNSAERAGAGRIYLIEQAKSAAIASGLPIAEPLASLLCDLGGGTTEIAIFSLGEIVVRKSLRLGGDEFDQAIIEYVRHRYSLRIGDQIAEQIKRDIGSATPLKVELTTELPGLDLYSGTPRRAVITSEEIRIALQPPLLEIVQSIRRVIEQCHPELVADLSETGIMLTGSGALLRGIDQLLTEQLGIPVRIDIKPETSVARGLAICLEHLDHWRQSFIHEAVEL
jgi:rod shape-determining protein MreB